MVGGCRCRNTLPTIASVRLRGLWSSLWRMTDLKTTLSLGLILGRGGRKPRRILGAPLPLSPDLVFSAWACSSGLMISLVLRVSCYAPFDPRFTVLRNTKHEARQ